MIRNRFEVGNRVVFAEGPFEAMAGRVVQVLDGRKLIVHLVMLGREITVETWQACLLPAGNTTLIF